MAHPGLNIKPAAMKCIANFGAIQSRSKEKSTVLQNEVFGLGTWLVVIVVSSSTAENNCRLQCDQTLGRMS